MNDFVIGRRDVLRVRGADKGRAELRGLHAGTGKTVTVALWARIERPGILCTLSGPARSTLTWGVGPGGQVALGVPAADRRAVVVARSILDDDAWHHLVLRLDGHGAALGRATLFVDGICVHAGAIDLPFDIRGVDGLVVGETADLEAADLGLWYRALADAERSALRFERPDAETLQADAAAAGYWPLAGDLGELTGRAGAGELKGPADFGEAWLEVERVHRALRVGAGWGAVRVPSRSAYDVGAAGLTLEAWVRTTGPALLLRRARGEGPDRRGFEWALGEEGRLVLRTWSPRGSAEARTTGAVDDALGRWCHVAVSVAADGRVRMFADARPLEMASDSLALPFDAEGAPLAFGQDVQETLHPIEREGEPVGGPARHGVPRELRMSEVRIWSGPRSQGQIFRDMGRAATGGETGLRGYWDFATGHAADRVDPHTGVELPASHFALFDHPIEPAQYALALPSSAAGLRVAQCEAFAVGGRPFTLEVTVDAVTAGEILCAGARVGPHVLLAVDAEGPRLSLRGADGTVETFHGRAPIVGHGWRHICWRRTRATQTPGTVSLLVDGVDIPLQQTASRVLVEPRGALSVGGVAGAMTGRLDDLRVWSELRSVQAVRRGAGGAVGGPLLNGCWSFEHGIAHDAGNHRAHGTLVGGATVEAVADRRVGAHRAALEVGPGGWAECLPVDVVSGRRPFSFAGWIRPTATDVHGLVFGRLSADRSGQFGLRLDGGRPEFRLGDRSPSLGPAASGAMRLLAGRWYHVAVTGDRRYVRLYVNGAEVGRGAVHGDTPTTALPFTIGGADPAERPALQIDGLGIWDRCLDAQAVQAAADVAHRGEVDDGALAWWHFSAGDLRDARRLHASARLHGRAGLVVVDPLPQPEPALALSGAGAGLDCGAGHVGIGAQMTVEGWFRLDGDARREQVLISKGHAFELRRTGSRLSLRRGHRGPDGEVRYAELTTRDAVLVDGRWHHVAVVVDEDVHRIVVDGRCRAEFAVPEPLPWDAEVHVVAWPEAERAGWWVLEGGPDGAVRRLPLPEQARGRPTGLVGRLHQVGGLVLGLVGDPGRRRAEHLLALDPLSGAVRWVHPLDPEGPWPVRIEDGAIRVRNRDDWFDVDPRDGRDRAKWTLPPQARPPTVHAGVVYTVVGGAEPRVVALDAESGEARWTHPLPGEPLHDPRVWDHGLVVACADHDLRVVALRLDLRRPGRELWRWTGEAGWRCALEEPALAVYDGVAFVERSAREGRARLVAVRGGQATELVRALPGADSRFETLAVDADGHRGCLCYRSGATPSHPIVSIDMRRLSAKVWQRAWWRGCALVGDTIHAWSDTSFEVTDADDPAGGRRYALQRGEGPVPRSSAVGGVGHVFPLWVGGHPERPEASVRGMVREVRLWRVAHAVETLDRLRGHVLAGRETGLVGYWPCADGGAALQHDRGPRNTPARPMGAARGAFADHWLKPAMPELTVQAELMEGFDDADMHRPKSEGRPEGACLFRVRGRLLDGRRHPMADGQVSIWADAPCTLRHDGVTHRIDAEGAIVLSTGRDGSLSFAVEPRGLAAPTLRLHARYMSPHEAVVLHPDGNLHGLFADIERRHLVDPDGSQHPLLVGKAALLPGAKAAEADDDATHLAHALRHAVSSIEGSFAHPMADGGLWDAGHVLGRVGPVGHGRRAVKHGTEWRLHFGDRRWARLDDDDRARIREGLRPEATGDTLAEDSWWSRFWQTVTDAVSVAFHTIDDIAHIVVEVAEGDWRAVEATVEHIGEAIAGIIRRFGKLLDEALRFFARLFDWGDILRTHDALVDDMKSAFDVLDLGLAWLDARLVEAEHRAEAEIEKLFGPALAFFERGRERFDIGAAVRDHGVDVLHGGGRSAAAEAARSHPTMGLQGQWVTDRATTDGSKRSSAPTAAHRAHPGLIQRLHDTFESIVDDLRDAGAARAAREAWKDVEAMLHQPERILELGVATILRLVEAVVMGMLEALVAGARLLVALVRGLLDTIHAVLTARINLPLLSWLYERVTGEALTAMNLGALAIAVPATAVYKAFAGGRAPFPEKAADPATADGGPDAAYAPDWPALARGVIAALQAPFIGEANVAAPPLLDDPPRGLKAIGALASWISQILGGFWLGVGYQTPLKIFEKPEEPTLSSAWNVFDAVVWIIIAVLWVLEFIGLMMPDTFTALEDQAGAVGLLGCVVVGFWGLVRLLVVVLIFSFGGEYNLSRVLGFISNLIWGLQELSRLLRERELNKLAKSFPWAASVLIDFCVLPFVGLLDIAVACIPQDPPEDPDVLPSPAG